MSRKELGDQWQEKVPEWFFNDPLYAACIRQCIGNKTRGRQGYGAVLVDKDGYIVSTARNILVHTSEPWRIMGYANHAEGMAIFLAEVMGRTVRSSELYVGGILESGLPFVFSKPNFTCERCAKLMVEYGLGGIYVPTYRGWAFLSAGKALEAALYFKNSVNDNASGRHNINWMQDYEVAEAIIRSILERPVKEMIGDLRRMGYGVSRKAALMMEQTQHGYVGEKELKELWTDLVE